MSVGNHRRPGIGFGLGRCATSSDLRQDDQGQKPIEVRGCPPLLDVGRAAGLAACLPVSNLWHAVSYPVFPSWILLSLQGCWGPSLSLYDGAAE